MPEGRGRGGGPPRDQQTAEPTLSLAPPPPEPGLVRASRIWLVVAALAAALMYAGLHTPYFLVRQVRVDGLVQLTRQDVAAAADILPGTYLWQVRPWTIAARLQRIPLLASVRVGLDWPDAVTIRLAERRPDVLLDAGESADLEVDAAGRVIALAAKPGAAPTPGLLPAPHVPLVAGIHAAGARPGEVLSDPRLGHVLAVAAGLGVQGQALLGRLQVGAGGDVTADLADGIAVHFGDGSHARAKTQILLGLLQEIAKRHLSVDAINLASLENPSVHLRAAAVTSPTPTPARAATASASVHH